MASNNLRIIYQNLIDFSGTGTIAVSSTAGVSSAAYLKYDYKALRWRSVAASTTTARSAFIVTTSTASSIGGIILAFSNLSSSAKIRVRGYTGTTPTVNTVTDATTAPTITTTGATLQFDTSPGGVSSGTVAAPYQGQGDWSWGINTALSNAYYNKYVYARIWLTPAQQAFNCTSWVIEIEDTACTDQYLEVGRIIMGKYWSPKYNTSYGLSATIKDLSTSERTEAGDLVTKEAPYFNTLSLELRYMDKNDRAELLKLYRTLGTRRPLFISVFPDNSDDWGKEGTYQLFGKFSTITGISHTMFDIYASQLDIEEV